MNFSLKCVMSSYKNDKTHPEREREREKEKKKREKEKEKKGEETS